MLAEKDGDVAYVGSDWTEGISSWEFGIRSDLRESPAVLRGSVFTDRGVYRLGEQVHVKAILRSDTNRGIQLLPAGTPVYVTLRDSQYREVETRTIRLNEWSSADWTMNVPAAGSLGQLLPSGSARTAADGTDGSGQPGRGDRNSAAQLTARFWWRHTAGPTSASTRR